MPDPLALDTLLIDDEPRKKARAARAGGSFKRLFDRLLIFLFQLHVDVVVVECAEEEEVVVADAEDHAEAVHVVKLSSGHSKFEYRTSYTFVSRSSSLIHILFPLKLLTFV